MKINLYLIIYLGFNCFCYSQSGNHVFEGSENGGSEFVNFGTIDLGTGTQRWTTSRTGYLSFFSAGLGAQFTGSSDSHHVNGYVKKYGDEAFTFPVGSGTDLREISMSAPGTNSKKFAAAWIEGDPTTTIDPSENILHPISEVAFPILKVMDIGQWDFLQISEGPGHRRPAEGEEHIITASMPNLSSFVGSAQNLRLVGWSWSESKWVNLSSGPNATGKTENSTISGLLNSSIGAISIGLVGSDFTPVVTTLPTLAIGETTFSSIINIYELNNIQSDGSIEVKIPKNPNFQLEFFEETTTIGNIPVNNGKWSFSEDSEFYTFKSNAVIVGLGVLNFGVTGTFNPNGANGTMALTAIISNGSGGEVNSANNTDNETITYFVP